MDRRLAAGAASNASSARGAKGLALANVLVLAAALYGRGLTTSSLAGVQILLFGLVLMALLRAYRTGLQLPATPVAVVLSGLAGWLLAALMLFSSVHNIAVYGFFLTATLPLAFFIFHYTVDLERGWPLMARGLLVLGLILAVLGLMQSYLLGRPPTTVFVQTNSHAAFLNLVTIPYLATVLARAGKLPPRSRRMAPHYLPLGVLFLAIASGLGRGAMLGFLLGAGLVLWRSRRWVGRERMLFVVLLFVSAFGLASALNQFAISKRFAGSVEYALSELGIDVLGDGGLEGGYLEGKSSLFERVLIWRAALRMIEEAPWYGRGIGTFHQIYPRYRDPRDTSAGQYAHNDLLQYWFELGYPGLVLLLALAVAAAAAMARIWRAREHSPETRLTASGVFGALLALGVHSLFSYNLYILPFLIVCGWMLAYLSRLAYAGPRAAVAVHIDRWLRPWVFAGLCVVSTGAVMALLGAMMGMDYSYARAREHMLNGDLARADRELLRAERLFDTEAVQTARALLCSEAMALVPVGETAQTEELRRCAKTAIARAQALNPNYAESYFQEGQFYRRHRERAAPDWPARARAAYLGALRRNDRHFEARLGLAQLLYAQGEIRAAHALMERGLAYGFPEDPAILGYARFLIGLREELGYHDRAERLRRRAEKLERVLGEGSKPASFLDH